MKNRFIAILSLTLSLAAFTGISASEKPNVVLVFMDNFGYGELGSYGGGKIRGAATPRLDALAEEGLRLTNFNVESQCVPSRSALMTGRYPIRSGATKVPFDRAAPYGPTQWEYTMAEMFSDAGYATGMIGKWHLGHTEGRFPTDQGFDWWWGIPNSTDEVTWDNNPRIPDDASELLHKSMILTATKGEKQTEVKLYGMSQRPKMDGEITDMAIDYIKKHAKGDKPYFLYLPYTLAHQPRMVREEFEGKSGNGTWGDLLTQIDFDCGRVLDAVEESGTKDNTIFIFTSDNGGDYFSDGSSSGPWRGSLFTALEGSLRVPFIIRWPGKIPADQVSNEIVHIIDLLPTLANAAGGNLPDDRIIDGMDMTELFTGKSETSPRDHVVAYVSDQIYAVKWRNWKLAFNELDHGFGKPVQKFQTPIVYDLISDPREERPFVPDGFQKNGWIGAPIMKRLSAHLQSLKDEPPIKEGTPDPYVPKKSVE